MELLAQYFQIQQQLFDYFGYRLETRILSLQDRTSHYWLLDCPFEKRGQVFFFSEPITEFVKSAENHSSLFQPDTLEQWVYPGQDYTLIVTGQRDLSYKGSIFANAKEVTSTPELLQKLLGDESRYRKLQVAMINLDKELEKQRVLEAIDKYRLNIEDLTYKLSWPQEKVKKIVDQLWQEKKIHLLTGGIFSKLVPVFRGEKNYDDKTPLATTSLGYFSLHPVIGRRA